MLFFEVLVEISFFSILVWLRMMLSGFFRLCVMVLRILFLKLLVCCSCSYCVESWWLVCIRVWVCWVMWFLSCVLVFWSCW